MDGHLDLAPRKDGNAGESYRDEKNIQAELRID
jgi:hypothetical protein